MQKRSLTPNKYVNICDRRKLFLHIVSKYIFNIILILTFEVLYLNIFN